MITELPVKEHNQVSSNLKSIVLINSTSPVITDLLLKVLPDYLKRNNGRYPPDECSRIDSHTIGVIINDSPKRLYELIDNCLSKEFSPQILPSGVCGSISFDTISSYDRITSERNSLKSSYLLYKYKR